MGALPAILARVPVVLAAGAPLVHKHKAIARIFDYYMLKTGIAGNKSFQQFAGPKY